MRNEENGTTSSVKSELLRRGATFPSTLEDTIPWATLHILRISAVKPDRDLMWGVSTPKQSDSRGGFSLKMQS